MQAAYQAPAATSAVAQLPWQPEPNHQLPISDSHVRVAEAAFVSTGRHAPLSSASLSQAGPSFTSTSTSSPFSVISAQINSTTNDFRCNNRDINWRTAVPADQQTQAGLQFGGTRPPSAFSTSTPPWANCPATGGQASTVLAPSSLEAPSPFAALNPSAQLLSSFSSAEATSFQSTQNPFIQAKQRMAPQSLCSHTTTSSFPSSVSMGPSSVVSVLCPAADSAGSHMTHVMHMDCSTTSLISTCCAAASVQDFDMQPVSSRASTLFTSSNAASSSAPVHPQFRTARGVAADLQIIKRLGAGAYGQVYLGKVTAVSVQCGECASGNASGVSFAAVKYAKLDDSVIREAVESLWREEGALKLVKEAGGHHNVLSLVAGVQAIAAPPHMCMQATVPAIALEFAMRGSLEDLLHPRDPATWWKHMQKMFVSQLNLTHVEKCAHKCCWQNLHCPSCVACCCVVLQWLSDAAKGLDCLHTLPMAMTHNDIKPGNVLVSAGGVAKLADFGLATCHPADGAASPLLPLCGDQFGTAAYAAPEVILGTGGLSCAADMYSWGCMLWEAFSGKMPWSHLRDPDPHRFCDVGAFWIQRELSAGNGLVVDESWPVAVKDLLGRCLSGNPAHRPKAAEAVAALQQEIEALKLILN